MLEQQEIYWQQRTKQFWLREGDQNTKFFHKYASTRRQNNSILGLQDGSGNWVQADSQVILQYFNELFASVPGDRKLSSLEGLNQVTMEQNNNLIQPISPRGS